MFNQITIVGMGLIGSSIARAIRKHSLSNKLVAADLDSQVCTDVMDLNIADTATTDIANSVRNSDLVIICVPAGAYGTVGQTISQTLSPDAIVTDVSGVKQSVVEALAPHMPEGVHLVPGHPIAGTEHSGPHAGFAELFIGRWCILTPLPDTDIRAVERVTKLWEAMESVVEIMTPERHDLVLGITSHLPHLIAYTIVDTADALEDETKAEVIKFSASGFRDFTRIAASDPTMWRDIFLYNKEAVLDILQRFNEDLTALQKAIRQGDGDYLFDTFSRTRAIRKEVIEQGQADYRRPDGSIEKTGTPPPQRLKDTGS